MVFRRGRRSDIDELLAVDHKCFGDFWKIDEAGIQDARTRDRVRPLPGGRIAATRSIGYAITGRQGRAGYLQRLAVDPSERRIGLGSALVLDGVRWLARWHARSVLVNTQESNATALALYESLHFRRKPEGLEVLSTSVPA